MVYGLHGVKKWHARDVSDARRDRDRRDSLHRDAWSKKMACMCVYSRTSGFVSCTGTQEYGETMGCMRVNAHVAHATALTRKHKSMQDGALCARESKPMSRPASRRMVGFMLCMPCTSCIMAASDGGTQRGVHRRAVVPRGRRQGAHVRIRSRRLQAVHGHGARVRTASRRACLSSGKLPDRVHHIVRVLLVHVHRVLSSAGRREESKRKWAFGDRARERIRRGSRSCSTRGWR